MNEKKDTKRLPEDAEARLSEGLALVLSALPELILRWLKAK